jgi:hypothetical protein
MSFTHWEDVALQQLEDFGPRPAGSGIGAVSDACWHLLRCHVLEIVDRAGVPYVQMTAAGRAAWLAHREALISESPATRRSGA